MLGEILDAWFAGEPSTAADDRDSLAHLGALERAAAGPDGGGRDDGAREGAER